MISPAINELILRVFDHSAQGISILLENLKPLFLCESIYLSSSLNPDRAANDSYHKIEDSPFADSHLIKSCHPAFKASDQGSTQLKLTIKSDESLSLILQFAEDSSLKKCLSSHDIKELIPHIQQAVIIAEQISQQRGDVDAIQYVMTHHPLVKFQIARPSLEAFGFLPTPNKPSILTKLEQTYQSAVIAANSEINLELSKDFLKQVYSLTPSEAELTKFLFNGRSLQNVADIRLVSKQTIRKQFQSVLKKTQCESQEALIIEIFDALLARLNKPQQQ